MQRTLNYYEKNSLAGKSCHGLSTFRKSITTVNGNLAIRGRGVQLKYFRNTVNNFVIKIEIVSISFLSTFKE